MGSLSGLRDDLVSSLEKSLVGPLEGPTETFRETPDRRYVSGILYPKGLQVGEAEDSNDIPEGDSDMDAAVPSAGFSMVSEREPSSMGLSVRIG